jgi:hypothetical protein
MRNVLRSSRELWLPSQNPRLLVRQMVWPQNGNRSASWWFVTLRYELILAYFTPCMCNQTANFVVCVSFFSHLIGLLLTGIERIGFPYRSVIYRVMNVYTQSTEFAESRATLDWHITVWRALIMPRDLMLPSALGKCRVDGSIHPLLPTSRCAMDHWNG